MAGFHSTRENRFMTVGRVNEYLKGKRRRWIVYPSGTAMGLGVAGA